MSEKGKRSDLPVGSEFSPSQIVLPELLEMVQANAGNWRALEKAIKEKYFSEHGKKGDGEYNRAKLANNTKLGLIGYGILDRKGNYTDFGKALYDLRTDEAALYKALARHILLNLRGMSLVECIRDMTAAGEEINLTTLRDALGVRGTHFPKGGKHPSMMRLWLAKAGIIIGSRWQIDEAKLQDVLGTDPAEFAVLARFTAEQRAFVRALGNLNPKDPIPANEVTKLATATFGVKFPEKSLPKLVLNALEAAGYITKTKTTTGRGAKPFLVAPTAKLSADLIEPLLDQLRSRLDPKLLDLLRKSLSDILSDLDAKSPHVRGLALEALAFKLMRLLDMDYVATRLRGSETGGAEVDLIFQAARLIFSRWQVQCKNTSRVKLDDVAKEVGLTHMLKSNVIVMVSTGEIGGEARRYANKIMADSTLCIVMIDRADLETIRKNQAYIVDAFRREAKHAMMLKSLTNN